jgi:hypothetical protein
MILHTPKIFFCHILLAFLCAQAAFGYLVMSLYHYLDLQEALDVLRARPASQHVVLSGRAGIQAQIGLES